MDTTLLKESLGEELYAQVAEKLNAIEGMRLIATDDGSWLPKSRLDEEIAKRNELKRTVSSLTEEAQASAGLREENARLARQVADLRRDGEIREALTAAHARDAGLIGRLIDREGIDSGEAGLEAQIAALRERCPYLFADEEISARGGFGGAKYPREGGSARGDVNGAIRAAAGRY